MGLAAAFSFYPTKVLTTGEGGMITTNDKNLYRKFLSLREHGKKNVLHNIHSELGYNWRLPEISGLLGIQQVKKANEIVKERRKIALLYDEMLQNNSNLKLQKVPPIIKSSYYKYIIFVKSTFRDKIKTTMYKKYGISLPGEVYRNLCHSQPVFKKHKKNILKRGSQLFTNAKKIASSQLCLPLYPGLKNSEIRYIANSLIKVLKDLE